MKLAIFGATGPTGQQLVKQALKNGHKVTVLARRPEKLTIQDKNLTIIKGDALNYEDVEKAVRGQDAVLSALGVKPPSRGKVVGPATKNIIKAMKAHRVNRLIVESAFFMDGNVKKGMFVRLLNATFMKGLYEDKKEQNKALASSNVGWTEVRPTMLTNGPISKHKVGVVPGTFSKISRANVADFMLKELEENKFVKKSVIVTE
jgi:putative NADH-flavin reductase